MTALLIEMVALITFAFPRHIYSIGTFTVDSKGICFSSIACNAFLGYNPPIKAHSHAHKHVNLYTHA